MGFLSDLGRSNAISSVNTLATTAIQLKGLQNQDEQRQYENAINLEKLGMAKETEKREATKFQWQADEQAKKQKFLKSVVPVDTLLQNTRPGSREKLLQLGKDNGWIQDVGGNLVISNENIANAKQHLNSNLEFISQLALTDVADINKEMGPLKQQLAELKSTKPDDKTIPILEKQISDLDKQKTAHLNSALEIDKSFQEKKSLAESAAASKNKLIKTKAGVILQANDQGGYDEIYTPPEKVVEPKTDQDRFVEDRAAAFKAKSGKEATPDQRTGWRMEYHRAPQDTGARSDRAETKEEKRKVKALDTARREVERVYGYSQFLPTAQDPQLIEKVGKGKALVEDIIDNFKEYGLPKEPTPGKAAEISKRIIEKQYASPVVPGAEPVKPTDQAKKEMDILGLLRPKGNK